MRTWPAALLLLAACSHSAATRVDVVEGPTATSDVPVALPTADLYTPPPAPRPSLPPLPSAPPATAPPLPPVAPTAVRTPAASPTPYVEGSECDTATQRTGLITLTLEVCAFAAGEDSYTLTMRTAGDQVFRTVHVDHADGSTEPDEQIYQHSCSNPRRPNPMFHGERRHEWAPGTWDITATVVAHDCAPADQGGEDTDDPRSATVTFHLVKS